MDRKKSFILIILLLAIVLFSNVVYAKEDTGTGSGSVLEDITRTGGSLDKYKPGDIDGTSKLEEKAEYILGIIKNVGVVLSVVSLILLGIKYMLGSIEEKAAYKESFKPYIIGTFLVFTGSLLPELIYKFMQNLNK